VRSSVAILVMLIVLRAALAGEGEPLPVGATAPRERVELFHAYKFGVLVRWGPATAVGGEWAMAEKAIPAGQYRSLLKKFNPDNFDAAEWVGLFKAAGARYVVLVVKGFDGFCLFDSKLTDYDVMSTPFGRDVVKEVTNACRAAGLPIFYYYSLADWHHPEYWPWGWSGTRIPGRARYGDNEKYIAYYQGQLCELCTNYGAIDGIILDGEWDRGPQFYDLERTYAIVHKLQPQALVANNHGRRPMKGEDFQLFDLARPVSWPRSPFVPLATSMEIEPPAVDGKGRWRSSAELLRGLITTAGRGGNLHVVVRPRADGSIPPQQAKVLGEMGEWLRLHGKTLFNTHAGPWACGDWGACTWALNRVFLHLLKRPSDALSLPALPATLQKAAALAGNGVEFKVVGNGGADREMVLNLPEWDQQHVVDRIIELQFDRKLEQWWIPSAIGPNAKGVLVLSAESAELHGQSFTLKWGLMWEDPNDRITWEVKVPRGRRYHAVVTYSCPEATAGCEFSVGTEASRLIGKIEPTSSWQESDTIELPGTIELAAGRSTISVRATGEPKWAFMQLIRIELRPADAAPE